MNNCVVCDKKIILKTYQTGFKNVHSGRCNELLKKSVWIDGKIYIPTKTLFKHEKKHGKNSQKMLNN